MTGRPDTDPWLRVLAGEAPLDTLPPERRENARRVLEAFRAAVAAPAFDADRLRRSLRALDAAPRVFTPPARPFFPRAIRAAAALLLAAAGLALAWLALQAPAQPPLAQPALERVAPGHWRIHGHADIHTAAGSSANDDDSVVLLRHGDARVTSDPATPPGTEVLRALGGQLSLQAGGELDVALTAPPAPEAANAPSTLAFSIYAAAPDAVFTTAVNGTPHRFHFAANSDAVVVLKPAAAQPPHRAGAIAVEPVVAHWPDVSAATPPVTMGEVFLRLRTGRIVSGIVTGHHPTGLLLSAPEQLAAKNAGAAREPTDFERIFGANDPHQPESILFEEIAAWTPRLTPRGRDTCAQWIQELLPAQLTELTPLWLDLLAKMEPGFVPEFDELYLVNYDWRLPDVTYRVVRAADGLAIQATHTPSRRTWTLDALGRLRTPATRPDRDF